MALKAGMKGFKVDSIPKWAQILIVVLIPLLVGTGFYFLYVKGKFEEISRYDKQIQDIQKEIAKNETKARRLAVLKEQNEWLKQRLDELQDQLPKESEIVELLRRISEKAIMAGLELVKWRPGTRRANPNGLYDEIPVEVIAVGGYHDLGVFFNGISQLKRIVNISGIKMDPTAPVRSGKRSQSRLAGRTDLLKAEFRATTFAVSTAPPPEAQQRGKARKK